MMNNRPLFVGTTPTSKMSAATTEISAEEYAKFQEWKIVAEMETVAKQETEKHQAKLETLKTNYEADVARFAETYAKDVENAEQSLKKRLATIRTIRHTPAIPSVRTDLYASKRPELLPVDASVRELMEQITDALKSFGPNHVMFDGHIHLVLSLPLGYQAKCSDELSKALMDQIGYTLVLGQNPYIPWSSATSRDSKYMFGVSRGIQQMLEKENRLHHVSYANLYTAAVDVPNRTIYISTSIKS